VSHPCICNAAWRGSEPLADELVLHIEDNPSNRKVVRYIFRQTDYRLLEAESGEDGLSLMETERPDLVLLDMQLPGMTGYEVAARAKADDRYKEIPIIALTSYALSGDDRKAFEAGCDDYIAKPYTPDVLLECMRKHLLR